MNVDYGKEDGERMEKIGHFVLRHRELSAKCKELASELVSGVIPFYDFHLCYPFLLLGTGPGSSSTSTSLRVLRLAASLTRNGWYHSI